MVQVSPEDIPPIQTAPSTILEYQKLKHLAHVQFLLVTQNHSIPYKTKAKKALKPLYYILRRSMSIHIPRTNKNRYFSFRKNPF